METTTVNTGKETANEILRQLGGNRFIAMTGSKNFIYNPISETNPNFWVRMDLARNSGGVNRLKITLQADDTYTMEFYKMTSSRTTFETKITNKKEFKMIYCDQLQEIFTEVTGLYTSL